MAHKQVSQSGLTTIRLGEFVQQIGSAASKRFVVSLTEAVRRESFGRQTRREHNDRTVSAGAVRGADHD